MPGRLSNTEAESSRKRPRFAETDDGESESGLEVREARSNLRGDGVGSKIL